MGKSFEVRRVMKKLYVISGLLVLVALAATGCGNGQSVCQEADEILANCNGDNTDGSTVMGPSNFLNCDDSAGQFECRSQCVVDNPDGACQVLTNQAGDADLQQEFADCIANCFI